MSNYIKEGTNTMKMADEFKFELTDHLLPFWSNLIDNENGGFFGYVDFHGKVDKKSPKSSILNSRILWFFSSVYCLNKSEVALKCAKHAYRFLKEKQLDRVCGGLYWMVDYKGEPCDNRKHTYTQSFAIYGLVQYYLATKDESAIKLAIELFELVEKKCVDDKGCLEEFDRQWGAQQNEMLSEHNIISSRTMNTHLHLIEAYTSLFEVTRNETIKERLVYLLKLTREKIYDNKNHYLKVFFNDAWEKTLEIQSYGHDIEGSWLIDRAVEMLEDEKLMDDTYKYTLEIAENTYANAYSPEGVINETVEGKTDTDRIWWVQAESVIGFYNAYTKSGDKKFLDASVNVWNYIKKHVLDKEIGEWYYDIGVDGSPMDKAIVSPWKCPYHNSRMCIEMLKRLGDYV
jgi:mannobiose 2-epimerase